MPSPRPVLKARSDVFICQLKNGDYRAFPSPCTVAGRQRVVQPRNLTDCDIEIDLEVGGALFLRAGSPSGPV